MGSYLPQAGRHRRAYFSTVLSPRTHWVTLRLANPLSTLARPDVAEIVAVALAYADGSSYHLRAWCIMPNHVHAVLRVRPGETLERITGNWKAFSSKRARRILRSDGAFWEPQHHERPLRTEGQIAAAVDYVLASPRRSGLMNWPWAWSDRLIDAVDEPQPMPPMPVHLAAREVCEAASL